MPGPNKAVTLVGFVFAPFSTDAQLACGVLVLVALSAGGEQRLERVRDLDVGVVTVVTDVGDDVLFEDLFGPARLLQCSGVHLDFVGEARPSGGV